MLIQIGGFRTVTPVRIHWWLWNDTQSLMLFRRGALLFFEVIYQMSRSQRLKNLFESDLSKIARPVAATKSLRFALFFFFFSQELAVEVFKYMKSPLVRAVSLLHTWSYPSIHPSIHPSTLNYLNGFSTCIKIKVQDLMATWMAVWVWPVSSTLA